jgi:hypothetical protein
LAPGGRVRKWSGGAASLAPGARRAELGEAGRDAAGEAAAAAPEPALPDAGLEARLPELA